MANEKTKNEEELNEEQLNETNGGTPGFDPFPGRKPIFR
jgi:hypothetical protein